MNEEINQLEQYIFAKDRRLFLDNLIKDTESHYYFSLLDAIDNQGNSLTHEQEEDLKRYRKFRTASSKGIRVRYLFRQYDKADSEETKKKVISELNSKLFKVTGVLPLSQTLKKEFDYGGLQVQQQQQQYQQQQISSNIRPVRMQQRRHSTSSRSSSSSHSDEGNQDRANLYEEMEVDEPQLQVEEGSCSEEDEQQLQLIEPANQERSDEELEEEDELADDMEEEVLDNKKDFPSSYDDKKLDVEGVIQKYSLEKLLYYLNQDNLIRIPIKKILSVKDYYQIQQYLEKVDVYALSCEELKEILQHYQSLLNKNKNIEQEVVEDFHKYTLAQLQSIATYLPDVTKNRDYIKYYFLKQFDVQHLNTLKGQARIDQLHVIYEWSQGLKQKFQSLQDQILFEILYQGIQFDIYDHKLFMDYIKNPKEQISELNEQNQKKFRLLKKSYDSFWHGVHSFESSGYSQVKLIKKYIKKHLKNEKSYSVSPYDEYFQDSFLQKMLIKVRLYGGDQNVPKVSKHLTPAEINTIYTSKEVKILKSNKQIFAQNEKITLNVQLKNIDKLYVKIFNFMPENYYLKNLSSFNEHVDLDGLNPNEEVFFDFKPENIHPCTRFVKTFDFDSIQKTPKGIFIIEFFSSGIASRAIIYKGSLTFFSKNTIAGQEIVILDQEGNIQSEGRVGIWIEKDFYPAKKDGRILLPYRVDTSKSFQAVLVSGNFASLTSLTHLKESYNFSCNYIYNQESFIFGNKAQVIIQPSLTIHSEVADISLLKNTEISIVTITTDDVPQTTRISKKTLQNEQDILVEFSLPAKTKQVKIEINTKLDQMNDAEQLKLNSNHSISIDQHANQLSHASFFLQNVDQYYILVLGKNGEPIPSFKVSVNIVHKHFQDYPGGQIKLQTNEEGSN